MPQAIISGMGYRTPDRIVTNRDIERIIETTEAFIVTRTGVLERRHMAPDQSLADLMIPAARQAMDAAGTDGSGIDMLIVNTLSPDNHDPSQACFVQPALGLGTVPSFDLRAQCSGALYGLQIARQFVCGETGCRRVLVVCAEALSKRMDTSNDGRNLSILLGDGAGAFVVERGSDDGSGVIDVLLGADGSQFDLLKTASPGSLGTRYIDADDISEGRHFFRMQGGEMFADACRRITGAARTILERNGLSLDDVDLIVPHQPNLRILDAVGEQLGVDDDRMFVIVDRLGNMASASLPVAMAMAQEAGRFRPGSLSLFVTYGSGATWGAALYRH